MPNNTLDKVHDTDTCCVLLTKRYTPLKQGLCAKSSSHCHLHLQSSSDADCTDGTIT